MRKILVFIFDLLAFLAALFLTLAARYQTIRVRQLFLSHLKLFLILYLVWLAISYIFDLWQARSFKNRTEIFTKLSGSIFVFFAASVVLLFFAGQFFAVAPKTNLLIFSAFFLFFNFAGRIILKDIFTGNFEINAVFLGQNNTISQLMNILKEHPELGYIPRQAQSFQEIDALKETSRKGDVAIIFPNEMLDSKDLRSSVYKSIFLGVDVISLSDFYESIFLKEPVEVINESWFVNNIKSKRLYHVLERIIDIFLSIVLLIILCPLIILIALLVAIFDPGDVFYNQERVGKDNKVFVLHKFRTMCPNQGSMWTEQNDSRITKIGGFLRKTHLDELPQLYNILKGDISFVGPRPEQLKAVKILREKIPYYDIRHLVKPGLTGWAQIHYKASASVEETEEKLKFDFYYVKNCSLLLDFLVLLKTAKLFFINPE